MAEIDRDAAVRYLLGEGEEAERDALERHLFEDEALAEQIEMFEDELVDAYVSGRLSPGERDLFEKAYLSIPDRAAKVQFARTLDRRLSAVKSRTSAAVPGPWRMLSLAATVVLAVGAAYFAYRLGQSRAELTRLQEQQASLERLQKELAQQLAEAQGERGRLQKALEQARAEGELYASELAELQRQAAGTFAFTLSGGLVRDSGSQQTLAIPRGATQAKLLMSVPADDYASYSAVIRTPEGKEVWKQASLAARRAGSALSLAVTVPARLLSAGGDYIATVTATTRSGRSETLADYAFRVRGR